MKNYKTVSEYIKHANTEYQSMLTEVRKIIQTTAPQAVEKIAYSMPAYEVSGKPLIYFAGMKNHLGIYPTPEAIQACAEHLKNFSTSKGCVRLKYTEKIPLNIIVKLVKARLKHIKLES